MLIKDIFFLLILIKLINLDNDNNFDDDDPITVISVRLLAWRSKFKKRKALKKKEIEPLHQQYTIWKYWSFLLQKIIHEGLI